MIAIDTNLIVRYLTGDHPEQSAKAQRLIGNRDVFVATTVLLETEWVLRSVYGYDAHLLATALTAFAGLPRVTVENAPATARALSWMKAGIDFADALHLAHADGCEAFATFDRDLAARKLGIVKIDVV